MEDIFKSFGKGHPENEFENILKAWDDNVGLNVRDEFNYSLEDDSSFANHDNSVNNKLYLS